MKVEFLLLIPIIVLIFIVIYLVIKNIKEEKQFQQALRQLNGMGFLDLKERTWIFRKGENHVGFTLIHRKRKELIYIDKGNTFELFALVNRVLLNIVERGKLDGE